MSCLSRCYMIMMEVLRFISPALTVCLFECIQLHKEGERNRTCIFNVCLILLCLSCVKRVSFPVCFCQRHWAPFLLGSSVCLLDKLCPAHRTQFIDLWLWICPVSAGTSVSLNMKVIANVQRRSTLKTSSMKMIRVWKWSKVESPRVLLVSANQWTQVETHY